VIWVVFLLLLVGAGIYLLSPFLNGARGDAPAALEEARQQRATVDQDEAAGRLNAEAAEEARDALDRRILASLDAPLGMRGGGRLKSIALGVVPAVLLLGGIGLYTQVGSPNYQPVTFAEFQAEQAATLPDSLEELVVQLRDRLEADPNAPADGYVLLARSYFRLGRIEDGLAAYEIAIESSSSAPMIVAERDRVVQMLQDRAAAPQIDPEARARIEAMSADDQAVMIENMVEGLAVRLEQEPADIQGWMRLIRARTVLGQADQAQRDLASAQKIFPSETPEGEALQTLAAELLPPPSNSAEE